MLIFIGCRLIFSPVPAVPICFSGLLQGPCLKPCHQFVLPFTNGIWKDIHASSFVHLFPAYRVFGHVRTALIGHGAFAAGQTGHANRTHRKRGPISKQTCLALFTPPPPQNNPHTHTQNPCRTRFPHLLPKKRCLFWAVRGFPRNFPTERAAVRIFVMQSSFWLCLGLCVALGDLFLGEEQGAAQLFQPEASVLSAWEIEPAGLVEGKWEATN